MPDMTELIKVMEDWAGVICRIQVDHARNRIKESKWKKRCLRRA